MCTAVPRPPTKSGLRTKSTETVLLIYAGGVLWPHRATENDHPSNGLSAGPPPSRRAAPAPRRPCVARSGSGASRVVRPMARGGWAARRRRGSPGRPSRPRRGLRIFRRKPKKILSPKKKVDLGFFSPRPRTEKKILSLKKKKWTRDVSAENEDRKKSQVRKKKWT
jgi:hypothetical protein